MVTKIRSSATYWFNFLILSILLNLAGFWNRNLESKRKAIKSKFLVEKKKILWWFVLISLGIIAIDQILKYLFLKFNFDADLGMIWLHLIFNTGAGFGILKNYTFILAIISLCAAILIIFNYKKIPENNFPQIFFAFLLGGILGNFIDRAFRGYVIDYFDLKFWPAFNLADACITISIISLIIWYWKKENVRI